MSAVNQIYVDVTEVEQILKCTTWHGVMYHENWAIRVPWINTLSDIEFFLRLDNDNQTLVLNFSGGDVFLSQTSLSTNHFFTIDDATSSLFMYL